MFGHCFVHKDAACCSFEKVCWKRDEGDADELDGDEGGVSEHSTRQPDTHTLISHCMETASLHFVTISIIKS